jgi:transcriptional regulator with XRE-family HTH domain
MGERRRELGRRIVQARKRRSWNQVELARRLEVPRDRLGKWERGLNAPSLEDLVALGEVLGLPLGELVLGRRSEEPFSSGELRELVVHLNAMARLLRPWMERKK